MLLQACTYPHHRQAQSGARLLAVMPVSNKHKAPPPHVQSRASLMQTSAVPAASSSHGAGPAAMPGGDVRWEGVCASEEELKRRKEHLVEAFPPKTDARGGLFPGGGVRAAAWSVLLNCPGNQLAFEGLVACGECPHAVDELRASERRGVKSEGAKVDTEAHESLVSALGHWCPPLSASTMLPHFSRAFLSAFGGHLQGSFEAAAMFLLRHGSSWFEFWPGPPHPELSPACQALRVADPGLYR
jgi:hypothetical protein